MSTVISDKYAAYRINHGGKWWDVNFNSCSFFLYMYMHLYIEIDTLGDMTVYTCRLKFVSLARSASENRIVIDQCVHNLPHLLSLHHCQCIRLFIHFLLLYTRCILVHKKFFVPLEVQIYMYIERRWSYFVFIVKVYRIL